VGKKRLGSGESGISRRGLPSTAESSVPWPETSSAPLQVNNSSTRSPSVPHRVDVIELGGRALRRWAAVRWRCCRQRGEVAAPRLWGEEECPSATTAADLVIDDQD
jgi:hypothetical protein